MQGAHLKLIPDCHGKSGIKQEDFHQQIVL
jgi:hypothetical protein